MTSVAVPPVVIAQHHALAEGRHRIGVHPLLHQGAEGDVVEANLGQRGGVAVATARIAVDLFHQLAHGVLAVADHLWRFAPRGGDQLVAHHQQAVVVARQVALDQDIFAEARGGGEAGVELLAGGDVDRHALALVAVLRLDHHRQADFQGGGPGIVRIGDAATLRHRHAGGVQQLLGQLLVLRDRFGNRAGGVDRTGRWAQAHVLVQVAQLFQDGGQVERRVVAGAVDQALRQFQRQAADVFLAVLDHHLVDAGFQRRGGAAEGDRAAGFGL